MVRQVLKGVALTAFENAATEHGNETVDNYKKCLQAVKLAIFPPKAATRQRRAIGKMRKPIEWTMRQFVARIQELNNQIPDYPHKEDGSAYSKHPEDELASFVEDGLPNKYCNFLREHGFNIFDHTMKEFVEFVETRIEPTDAKEDVKKEDASKRGNKRKNKELKDTKTEDKKSRKQQFFCKQHGYNNTHETENCRFLKSQRNNKGQATTNTRGNTSYVSKEEVHAMMQDIAEASAKAAVKKATAVWKRKREENHAVDTVNSAISKLELDCAENSASDSEFSS